MSSPAGGLLRLEERGLLVLSGPARQKFLNGMLSNEIVKLQPGQGCLAALMDVKGHIETLVRVSVAQDTLQVELPLERAAGTEATLLHYKVGSPVRFAQPPTAVIALCGAGGREALAGLGAALPSEQPEAHVETSLGGHAVRVVAASDLPQPALVLHVAAEAAAAVQDLLLGAGLPALERAAFDALRIEQGRPVYGRDVDASNLLHETGLVPTHHSPTKGCYLGQEVIARLEARGGNVNRALRGLRLSQPAKAGDIVRVGDESVGLVTTAAISPRLGPIALAYVHRNHFAAGTAVTVAGHAATVVTLPFEG